MEEVFKGAGVGAFISIRKKERIFICPFHAINIKRYDSSMYIIHTVE
jgi:hypothetical protein